MNDVTHLSVGRHAVDNTDWLKTAAIILVTVDHIGYFFIDQDEWWSVVGRLAAPIFFFLIGYSQTRAVPLLWIGLGVILTLLDSSNHNWTWVAPNILLSFALIRLGRPYAQGFVQRHRWLAFAVLTCMLLALLLPAAKMVDYGAEGWLWALFGLFQRMYVDGKSANGVNGAAQSSASPTPTMPKNVGLIRVLAGIVAAAVYIWQEQKEFSFSQIPFMALVFGVGILAQGLCQFRRGPSRIQPPGVIAGSLRFIGRHTLEIYAIELASFELIVKFVPALAP